MDKGHTKEDGLLHHAKKGLIWALVAVTVLGIAACGDSDDGGGGGEGLAEGEPIVIAQLMGPPEQGDPVMNQGMRIAAEEINQDGGVGGHQIEIESIETDASPESTSAAYREAGSRPNVLGVFNGSGGGLAVRNLSESVKVPAITASGNDAVDRPIARYVFANAETGPYATAPVRYAVEQFDAKTIGILHFEPDFDQQIDEAIRAQCDELGCEVVAVEEATSDASRSALVPRLTNLRRANADAYFISDLNANALPAARDLGLFDDATILGANYIANTALAEATGEAAHDVYFSSQKCRLSDLTELQEADPMREFCREYRQRWETMFPDEELQGFSVYGYDAVHAFAAAAETVLADDKPLNRETLTDALEQFDGEELFTSAGYVQTSADDHRMVGPFEQGFVMMEMRLDDDGPVYTIPEGADPAGSKP